MTKEEMFDELRKRSKEATMVENPLVPGERVGVRLLNGHALDKLHTELHADVRELAQRRPVSGETIAAERRLRVVARQILDASTLDGMSASQRYTFAELRAMEPSDFAKLEALVEAHGHIPKHTPLPPHEMSEAAARVIDAELRGLGGGRA